MNKEETAKIEIDKDTVLPTIMMWLEEGSHVAVYRNVAFDSAGLGHTKFLKVGPGATLPTAPERLPDMPGEINWKYRLETVLESKQDLDEKCEVVA